MPFVVLTLAAACGPDPSIDERNAFIRTCLESARDGTPFHREYARHRNLDRIDETRHLMSGDFVVSFHDDLGRITQHDVSYENGLRLLISVYGADGEIEWVIFKRGILTKIDRLTLHRHAFDEFVEMIRVDYDNASVVGITRRAIRTKSGSAIPGKDKPWKERWPISRERWESYSALVAELGLVGGVRFDNPPSGPILFALESCGLADNSHTTGLAFLSTPFVDEQWRSASLTFEPISDGWASFEHYAW